MLHSRCQFLALLLGSVLILPIAEAAPEPSDGRAHKQAETELLALHKEERRAHFDHDLKFLLAHVAPQLDVRDGRVNRMSREDVRERFLEYFKRSQFSAWDDVEPPIAHVSADGNTGWMIVQVRIAYAETNASGKTTNQNTVGTWMSAYERQNGTWVMTAVASAFGEN